MSYLIKCPNCGAEVYVYDDCLEEDETFESECSECFSEIEYEYSILITVTNIKVKGGK